ncbi:metallophosphatase family protein [Burkholderia cenocepacia]|uniref:metallophosphoesterase family protein n=1 Tax=Burkholderia cenocepacia TaxID=95486 RepID=UPI0022EB64D0|nr:metallophosphatase family protein [Burkholderia cenocepacia]MDA3669976.1 metallophosphatase family protein [Burkholderia cenocepacia]MDA3679770.1 metallophosphatase family protein [Burkholderia cenocepacia]MDA3687607.1 metallophosphatase family protein [Burkholderia cenocepacia]MDA3694990.1 metallophosphatase family protein [Burkholderia cenocepacia]MDA3701955.1 metallophosphatase family protein [Burkholderia cenocepacia]
MKIAHFSDLHYSPGNLDEADRCFSHAVGDAIAREAAAAVISGDSTDHRLDAHAPALNALARQVHRLAQAMPVLMLQGTFSHEPPGTLDNFALMGARYPVAIADRVCQVALYDGNFWFSRGAVFDDEEIRHHLECEPEAIFTCLPTMNKADLALRVGALAASTDVADTLAGFLTAAGRINAAFRAAGVPTVGVSHGTVNGCQTEHGVTMAGFDHEFSLGALFAAECSAFMLGHIHKYQTWEREGRVVGYPGSVGRFHYGELGDKGYLSWVVSASDARAVLVPTPSREMVSVAFDGPPDTDALQALAAASAGKFVRIRWQIDEEHKQLVDRKAIEAMFSAAAGVKLEPRVLPVMRSRAEGISTAPTVEAKLSRWCELADVNASPLADRLQLLETGDPNAIADSILARLAGDSASTIDQPCPSGAASIMLPTTAAASSDAVATADEPSWLTDDLFAA